MTSMRLQTGRSSLRSRHMGVTYVQPGIGAGSAAVVSGGGADRARMLPLGSTSPATTAATTKISAEYTNAVV